MRSDAQRPVASCLRAASLRRSCRRALPRPTRPPATGRIRPAPRATTAPIDRRPERRGDRPRPGPDAVSTSVDGRTQVAASPPDGSPATLGARLRDDPRVARRGPELPPRGRRRDHRGDRASRASGASTTPARRSSGEHRQTGIGGHRHRRPRGPAHHPRLGRRRRRGHRRRRRLQPPRPRDRAWTNPGEAGALATNGIDDDGNGFIDDVNGWDFCNGDTTVHDAGRGFARHPRRGHDRRVAQRHRRRRRRAGHQDHGRQVHRRPDATAAPIRWPSTRSTTPPRSGSRSSTPRGADPAPARSSTWPSRTRMPCSSRPPATANRTSMTARHFFPAGSTAARTS